MNRKMWSLVFSVLLLGVFMPRARASVANREVHFKINEPIEVPGRVLNPGRYDLKLASDNGSLAELWNARGSKFYGFYETVPADRSNPNGLKLKLLASENGSPERLSAWFYPGDIQGNQFLYPARANAEPANENCACTPHLSTR